MTFALLAALLLSPPSITVTVDSVDRPVCYEEDGSDANALPCVWFDPDTGRAWLTFSDHSQPINP